MTRAKMRFGGSNNFWELKQKEVRYLKSKCEWEAKKVKESYDGFLEYLETDISDGVAENIRAAKVQENLSDNLDMQEAALDIKFMNHQFCFHLDNFIISLKRVVEFNLRLLRSLIIPQSEFGEKFSLEAFLNHVNNNWNNDKSEFAKKIQSDFKEFSEYLGKNSSWLWELNRYRTNLSHKSVDYNFAEAKINFEEVDGDITYEVENVHMGDKLPEEKIDRFLENLEDFLTHVEDIANSAKDNAPIQSAHKNKDISAYISKLYR